MFNMRHIQHETNAYNSQESSVAVVVGVATTVGRVVDDEKLVTKVVGMAMEDSGMEVEVIGIGMLVEEEVTLEELAVLTGRVLDDEELGAGTSPPEPPTVISMQDS